MLTPEQFRTRWEKEVVATDKLPDDVRLVTVPSERLTSFRLPQAARDYLSKAGLPKACAPCLSFEETGKGLARLWEVFSPGQWQPIEKVGFEHYLMLGADGEGNPLCIDERDGKVVLLDHELLFEVKQRDSRTIFVNSSIPEFLESLLIYQGASPEAHLKALRELDPPAAQPGTFWSNECSTRTEASPGAVRRILQHPLGRTDTALTRWVWVFIGSALGIALALFLTKFLKR